ncbi:MAG: site-specific integrase [Anaerolineaceae bacterium]|nr:site-specific integrase [Anaerolineaceae bacterium]
MNTKIQSTIEKFYNHLILMDRDTATAFAYKTDVLAYVNCTGDTELKFSEEKIYGFLRHLRGRRLAPATIQRRIIGVLRCWRWAYKAGLSTERPLEMTDFGFRSRCQKRVTRALNENRFDQLLAYLEVHLV